MPLPDLAAMLFFQAGMTGAAIGAVVVAQGTIIGEKQLGTAAWLLSKPVSRSAFVLAKLVAHTLGFLALAIALPSLVFFGQSSLLWERVPALGPFLAASLVSVLHMEFYLALTVLLGTLYSKRGPVTGIALGFLFLGQFLRSIVPQVAQLMPWVLPDLAAPLALGQALPANAWVSIITTALGTIVCIGVALWRFGREEF